MEKKSYFEQVYDIVRQIPPGFVLNYGEIAYRIGDFSGLGAKIVGNAMRHAPEGLPCHRVVRKDGHPATCNGFDALLHMEGITFLEDGRVDMAKHLWQG